MSVGYRAWDENGNLVFDVSFRFGRPIAAKRLDGTNGSLPDDRFLQGGWACFQPDFSAGDGYLSGGVIVPRYVISGNTLSWSYAAKNNQTYDLYQTGILIYGAS